MNAKNEEFPRTVDPRSPPGTAPLVSIGLPVYNGERFLVQALDSLLGQTLADLELIISDNASTDRTAEICKDYAARDARIRYIRQESNRGAIWNFNFVAQQARGQYFKWAVANDFYDLRLLEKCVGVLRSDPGAVLCLGRTCNVDEDTGERTPCRDDFGATDARPSDRFSVVARSLKLNNPCQGVVRLDVLRRTPLVRRYFGGDAVLTQELALYGQFVLLPEILLYRRFGARTWSEQLSQTERRIFYFADASVEPAFPQWQRRIDLFGTVLRAPISGSEKLRIVLQFANLICRKFLIIGRSNKRAPIRGAL
jgi:glycosyltransferase involved in cell wall biosynthesis